MPASDSLTAKQEKFCQEYLIDLNATQAAIRAGYSKDTAGSIGGENLGKPEIINRLTELRSDLIERTKLSQEWVLSNLKEVAERSLQARPVLDRKGKAVVIETAKGTKAAAYQFDASGANRATELVGKHLGMFSDKMELSGPNGGPIMLGRAGDDAIVQEYISRHPEVLKLGKPTE